MPALCDRNRAYVAGGQATGNLRAVAKQEMDQVTCTRVFGFK